MPFFVCVVLSLLKFSITDFHCWMNWSLIVSFTESFKWLWFLLIFLQIWNLPTFSYMSRSTLLQLFIWIMNWKTQFSHKDHPYQSIRWLFNDYVYLKCSCVLNWIHYLTVKWRCIMLHTCWSMVLTWQRIMLTTYSYLETRNRIYCKYLGSCA